jgi:MFS family permease
VAGDQLARVALTVLVYERTASALLAAVTFAASIFPRFIGGLVLGSLADRFPRRAVMIVCDLLRCGLVVAMVTPGIPVASLVVLLFLVTLISAPFSAARSAIVPDILGGERYTLGQTITQTTAQFGQVLGFAVGGAVVGLLGTRTSLVIDAATFALSALIARLCVRARPAPAREAASAGPGFSADETPLAPADSGFRGAVRLVFTTPALLLPMLFGWLAAFYNAPEGVVAPLAASLGGGAASVGVILAAQVLGETAGMLVFGRLVPREAGRRWMGPLAIAACAVLILFALPPSSGVALLILFASGVLGCYQIAAIAAFVSTVPQHMRGAAFGLAQGGMSLGQGAVMIAVGAAAEAFTPAAVIAVTGGVGAVCAAGVAMGWARLREKSQRGA